MDFIKKVFTGGGTKPTYNHDVDEHPNDTLFRLASEGNEQEVKRLIERNRDNTTFNINYKDPEWKRSAVLNAAYMGHFSTTKYLLEQGASYESDHEGLTILALAVISGSYDLVCYLLNNGDKYHIDVNTPDKNGVTPLFFAINKSYTQIAEVLLKYGANINHQQSDGKTILSVIACYGGFKELKFLIEKCSSSPSASSSHQASHVTGKVNVNVIDDSGCTPLMLAIRQYNHDNAMYLLEYCGSECDLMIKDKNGRNVLMYAIEAEDTLLVHKILQTLSTRDPLLMLRLVFDQDKDEGMTSLMLAISLFSCITSTNTNTSSCNSSSSVCSKSSSKSRGKGKGDSQKISEVVHTLLTILSSSTTTAQASDYPMRMLSTALILMKNKQHKTVLDLLQRNITIANNALTAATAVKKHKKERAGGAGKGEDEEDEEEEELLNDLQRQIASMHELFMFLKACLLKDVTLSLLQEYGLSFECFHAAVQLKREYLLACLKDSRESDATQQQVLNEFDDDYALIYMLQREFFSCNQQIGRGETRNGDDEQKEERGKRLFKQKEAVIEEINAYIKFIKNATAVKKARAFLQEIESWTFTDGDDNEGCSKIEFPTTESSSKPFKFSLSPSLPFALPPSPTSPAVSPISPLSPTHSSLPLLSPLLNPSSTTTPNTPLSPVASPMMLNDEDISRVAEALAQKLSPHFQSVVSQVQAIQSDIDDRLLDLECNLQDAVMTNQSDVLNALDEILSQCQQQQVFAMSKSLSANQGNTVGATGEGEAQPNSLWIDSLLKQLNQTTCRLPHMMSNSIKELLQSYHQEMTIMETQQRNRSSRDKGKERTTGAEGAGEGEGKRDEEEVDLAVLMKEQSKKIESLISSVHEMKQELIDLKQMNTKQLQLLTVLQSQGNHMPHLFIILPALSTEKVSVNSTSNMKVMNFMKRSKEYVINCIWDTCRLVFVCPVTLKVMKCGPKGDGYTICRPREWLLQTLPVIRVGLLLAKIILSTQGLGQLIPSIADYLPDEKVQLHFLNKMMHQLDHFHHQSNHDTLLSCDGIETLASATIATNAVVSSSGTSAKDRDAWEACCSRPEILQNVYEVLAQAEGQEVSKIAMWKPTMTGLSLVTCGNTHESAWVSEEGKQAFVIQGSKAFKQF